MNFGYNYSGCGCNSYAPSCGWYPYGYGCSSPCSGYGGYSGCGGYGGGIGWIAIVLVIFLILIIANIC